MIIKPNWPAPKNVSAYTTSKSTWGAEPYFTMVPYSEFQKTSKKLEDLLQLPDEPIWLNQTHQTLVVNASPENRKAQADASIATEANRICVVTTADCLPILICNRAGSKVAAIHAGWRGLSAGIVENTLDSLDESGDQLLVWLGPAIGPEKFEVGDDVFNAFVKDHPEASEAFLTKTPGKWLANLYLLAKQRLKKRGISAIYGGDYCTFNQADLFFSYRRDHQKTGRMASLIWLTE